MPPRIHARRAVSCRGHLFVTVLHRRRYGGIDGNDHDIRALAGEGACQRFSQAGLVGGKGSFSTPTLGNPDEVRYGVGPYAARQSVMTAKCPAQTFLDGLEAGVLPD